MKYDQNLNQGQQGEIQCRRQIQRSHRIQTHQWLWLGLTVFLSLDVASLTACSPKIYVIDNQTVLEEEAAGNWPQFEKQVLDKAKAKGPTPLAQVPPNKARSRLYNVLNGQIPVLESRSELSSSSAPRAAAGSTAGAVK